MSINDTCIKHLRLILYMTQCDNFSQVENTFFHIFLLNRVTSSILTITFYCINKYYWSFPGVSVVKKKKNSSTKAGDGRDVDLTPG